MRRCIITSRIRQLVENDPSDVQSLHELVDYYKSLYTMLSAQAMEQVELNVKGDKFLRQYLFDALLTSGAGKVEVRVEDLPDSPYAVCRVEMQEVDYDEQLHHRLFTPLTHDMKYCCRQIVREIGEVTNLHVVGISARSSAAGKLAINRAAQEYGSGESSGVISQKLNPVPIENFSKKIKVKQ